MICDDFDSPPVRRLELYVYYRGIWDIPVVAGIMHSERLMRERNFWRKRGYCTAVVRIYE